MSSDLEGSAEKCRIVATRPDGAQVVISHHQSHQMAERAVKLMQNSSLVLRIEDEPLGTDDTAGQ